MASCSPGTFGLGVSNCRTAEKVLAAVQEAESCGASMAFIAEDVNCRDAFQLCALAAQRTRSIRLSPGVVNPFTRNPTCLAMAAATLDETSGGRAGLGLGTGSQALIEGQMGIAHGGSVQLMRETTEIVRALLGRETVDYHGERLRYAGARLEIEPSGADVPIYFAAMGPRMLHLAGQLADGVLLNVGASTGYVRWAVDQVRSGAVAAGRNPDSVTIAAWLSVYLVDSYDDGLEKARGWLATMLSIPRQGELLLQHAGLDTSILPAIRARVRAYPHGGDASEAARYVPPHVAEQLAIIGTPEQVLVRVEQYRMAGVDLPIVPITAVRALAT
ncbi:MAG: 5,10-methylenetetrahydromethanopterin reductase [Chloroflexota bacterium]